MPGASSPALGHGVAPGHDQLDPVLERQRAAGHQGGVLAETVPGARRRREAQPLHRIEDDQAEYRGGQLGVLGPRQLLNGGLEQEIGQVAPGRLGCLPDELPRGVVDPGLAHSGLLRTLSWEGENQHLLRRLHSSGGLRAHSVARPHLLPPHLGHACSYQWYDQEAAEGPNARRPNLDGTPFPVRPAAYRGASAAAEALPTPPLSPPCRRPTAALQPHRRRPSTPIRPTRQSRHRSKLLLDDGAAQTAPAGQWAEGQ